MAQRGSGLQTCVLAQSEVTSEELAIEKKVQAACLNTGLAVCRHWAGMQELGEEPCNKIVSP